MTLAALALMGLVQSEPTNLAQTPLTEDLVITQSDPDRNLGRDPFLDVGPGKVLLIRFPSLSSLPQKGKKLVSASIVFTPAAPGFPTLQSVGVVKRRWFEGGGRSSGQRDPNFIATGQATWNSPSVGAGKWDLGGAGGGRDIQTLEGVTGEGAGGTYTVTGLTATIQRMIDDPLGNHGLRLAFSQPGLFLSNESGPNKPRLQLEWEDQDVTRQPDLAVALLEPTGKTPFTNGQAVVWRAVVKNNSSVEAKGGRVEWESNGTSFGTSEIPAVPAGSEAVLTATIPWRPSLQGPRFSTVSVRVIQPDDAFPHDNSATAPIGGIRVYHPQAGRSLELANAVRQVNEDILPRSRYQMAMQGVTQRVQLVSNQEIADVTLADDARTDAQAIASSLSGLPMRSTKPPTGFPGVMYWQPAQSFGLFPETRDDVILLPGSPLPAPGWSTGIFQAPAEHGGLSLLEVLALNSRTEPATGPAFTPPWPNLVFVRLLNGTSEPIPQAKIEIFGFAGGQISAKPLVETTSDDNGVVLLSLGKIPAEAKDAGWFLVRGTLGGIVEQLWLPRWQIETEAVRNRLVSMDWRMMLPTLAYDRNTDLAPDRLITDSENRPPAALLGLADGDDTTRTSLKAGQWIQIDLGRDRALAEVELSLVGQSGGFKIQAYQTAQTLNDSFVWVEDSQVGQQMILRGLVGEVQRLSYRARPAVVRYIRLTATSPMEIAGIRLFAVGNR